jgi:hypothetical protein
MPEMLAISKTLHFVTVSSVGADWYLLQQLVVPLYLSRTELGSAIPFWNRTQLKWSQNRMTTVKRPYRDYLEGTSRQGIRLCTTLYIGMRRLSRSGSAYSIDMLQSKKLSIGYAMVLECWR